MKKTDVDQLVKLNCQELALTLLTECEELAGSVLQDRGGPSKEKCKKLTALIVNILCPLFTLMDIGDVNVNKYTYDAHVCQH